MSLGEFVRKAREERGLTQEELSNLSELPRNWIAQVELDNIKETSAKKILKLSKALRKKPEEFFAAAGYVKESKAQYNPKSIIDHLRELKTLEEELIAVPVVADLMSEDVLDYVYVARPRPGLLKYKAIKAEGISLEPQISEGDILVIDRDIDPKINQPIIRLNGKSPELLHYTEDVKDYYGVVVFIVRRL
jgi:transcriptional regulator with XRE-family HTH domain